MTTHPPYVPAEIRWGTVETACAMAAALAYNDEASLDEIKRELARSSPSTVINVAVICAEIAADAYRLAAGARMNGAALQLLDAAGDQLTIDTLISTAFTGHAAVVANYSEEAPN